MCNGSNGCVMVVMVVVIVVVIRVLTRKSDYSIIDREKPCRKSIDPGPNNHD